jgi:hypothetical protein
VSERNFCLPPWCNTQILVLPLEHSFAFNLARFAHVLFNLNFGFTLPLFYPFMSFPFIFIFSPQPALGDISLLPNSDVPVPVVSYT